MDILGLLPLSTPFTPPYGLPPVVVPADIVDLTMTDNSLIPLTMTNGSVIDLTFDPDPQ